MSDTHGHGEQDGSDREPRAASAGESAGPQDEEAGGPATSEAPSGDASDAAEQFSREEGEAPSG